MKAKWLTCQIALIRSNSSDTQNTQSRRTLFSDISQASSTSLNEENWAKTQIEHNGVCALMADITLQISKK